MVNYKDPTVPADPAVQAGRVGNLDNLFAPKGPRGKSAETLEKEAAAREKRFQDEQAQAADEFLSSLQALAGSTDERYRLQQESLQADHDRRAVDIDLQVREKQIDASKADELKQANDLVLAGKLAVLAMQKRAEQLQTITALQDQQAEYAKQALQAQSAFARTTADRLKNQLAQIDLDQQTERNRSIRTLFDPNASDEDKQTAGAALSSNQARFDQQRAVAREQNLTPGQQYVRSLRTTADTIQQKEVDVLGKFNDGLDQAAAKALHLHGILGDIVQDLIDMVVKQALIAPIANLLFPGTPGVSAGGLGGLLGGGGGIGGLLGGIGKLFGAGGGGWNALTSASIGGAVPSTLAVSSIDTSLLSLPGLAGGGTINVGGRGGIDRNTLSLNGQPVARVNMGEQIHVVNPNQRVNGTGGGTTVLQTIAVDARGAVMNDEFASMILDKANSHANGVGAAAYSASVRDSTSAAPGVVRKIQTYKD